MAAARRSDGKMKATRSPSAPRASVSQSSKKSGTFVTKASLLVDKECWIPALFVLTSAHLTRPHHTVTQGKVPPTPRTPRPFAMSATQPPSSSLGSHDLFGEYSPTPARHYGTPSSAGSRRGGSSSDATTVEVNGSAWHQQTARRSHPTPDHWSSPAQTYGANVFTTAGALSARTSYVSSEERNEQHSHCPWTPSEFEALSQGLRAYGLPMWKAIKSDPRWSRHLARRTPVDMKDKARNEHKARVRHNLPLGEFACVSGRLDDEVLQFDMCYC